MAFKDAVHRGAADGEELGEVGDGVLVGLVLLGRVTARSPPGNEMKLHPRGSVTCQASNDASAEHVRCVPLSNTIRRTPDLNTTADRTFAPNSGRAAATFWDSGVSGRPGLVWSDPVESRAGVSSTTSHPASRTRVSRKSMLILMTLRPRRFRTHRSSCSTGSTSVLITTPWSTSSQAPRDFAPPRHHPLLRCRCSLPLDVPQKPASLRTRGEAFAALLANPAAQGKTNGQLQCDGTREAAPSAGNDLRPSGKRSSTASVPPGQRYS